MQFDPIREGDHANEDRKESSNTLPAKPVHKPFDRNQIGEKMTRGARKGQLGKSLLGFFKVVSLTHQQKNTRERKEGDTHLK